MNLRRAVLLLGCGLALAARGGPVEDWGAILALDRGPQRQARNLQEARALAAAHLDQQERQLRGFLASYPTDEHAFEARLRLVRLLEIRGGFQGSEKALGEAKALLEALEKSATDAQRVEIEFAKVTRLMRGAQKSPVSAREQILVAARRFQTLYPGDRRIAALLAEVATLFDHQPRTKGELLNDAHHAAVDPALKGRIVDDIRRLNLLGNRVKLSFTPVQGPAVNIDDYLGRPVVVVFFADFSPPSMDALVRVQRALATLPKGTAAALAVNLDAKRETLDAALRATGLSWPVAFDGRGWEGDLVRSLSINALPTVWLFDKQGRLRSLNALEETAERIRQLARE